MLTVRDLLKNKGDDVWAIGPKTTTIQALRYMAEKKVGALLVIDDGLIRGIISERDFVSRLAADGACKLETPVSDYMTTRVFAVGPDTTIPECMALMTDRHFRHLPVIAEEGLVGIISIGDVVKAIISEQDWTIRNLEDYIVGGYRKI